jgi:catechol 2,3-dioxygenase-like lactoylglutathione lyase family enzyme
MLRGMAQTAFPADGMELTHLFVVGDMASARHFYVDVLGASVHREYGGTSCVLRFLGNWLLLVTGGGPAMTSRASTWRRRQTPTG